MAVLQTLKRQVQDVAPDWYLDLQLASWRSRSLPRILSQWLTPPDPLAGRPAHALRRDGIVVRRFEDVFSGTPSLEECLAEAHRLLAEVKRSADAEDGSLAQYRYKNKEFKLQLLPVQLSLEHIFVRLALDPRLLGVVNRYMGMRTYLRSVALWWDRPTEGPAKESQLWHRDADDLVNVKVFIYLTDVDLGSGPFCFIPTTHPSGLRRLVRAERISGGRSTDEQMERVVPRGDWRICTGRAGDVILCDTCGYHKGLKPVSRDRLMLMFQYTSGSLSARVPRTFEFSGSTAGLRPEQWWALARGPRQVAAAAGQLPTDEYGT